MYRAGFPAVLLSLALWSGGANVAHAQDYPNKPVRIILGLAPGGSTDVIARIVAQKLSEAWGQNVLVDNRVGAGGQTRAVNRGPLAGCERP